jgi:U3 small nucleolar RNA-associated protein 21
MEASLYTPYRAVGYVTDGVPFVVNQLGDELFLLVSIGKAIQIFKLDRLTSCLVSQQLPENITSLVVSLSYSGWEAVMILLVQACGHETYASSGSNIYVLWRTKVVNEYNAHSCEILGMTIVGNILLSYDCENNIKVCMCWCGGLSALQSDYSLQILDTKAREVVGDLQLLHDKPMSCLMHPATYLNKFLVGFSDGHLELWNVRRRCIIYTFKSHTQHFASASTPPGITCIEQSPACDVVAVGFTSGGFIDLLCIAR